MNPKLLFMIGPTNVGKSYLADAITDEYPDTHTVSVGKLLRAKYGEAYFKGQAAPEHTEVEALKLMDESIRSGLHNDSEIILIDGQPRTINQVSHIAETYFYDNFDCSILLLHCPDDIRMERLKKRDVTPYALELSISRFNDDMIHLRDVVYHLILNDCGGYIIPIDTTNNPLKQVKNFVNYSDPF